MDGGASLGAAVAAWILGASVLSALLLSGRRTLLALLALGVGYSVEVLALVAAFGGGRLSCPSCPPDGSAVSLWAALALAGGLFLTWLLGLAFGRALQQAFAALYGSSAGEGPSECLPHPRGATERRKVKDRREAHAGDTPEP